MDCSPPGSSVHGIFRVRILEWVAISYPGDLSDPGIETGSPALQADSTVWATREAHHPPRRGTFFSLGQRLPVSGGSEYYSPHPSLWIPPSLPRKTELKLWPPRDVFLALGLWDRVTLSYHLILCMFLWWQLSQWSVIMWTAVKPHACHRSLACIGQVQGGSSLI